MLDGIIINYFSFFSETNSFPSENNMDLTKTESWFHIDSSFNDYFLNIFLKNSEIKSIPEKLIDSETFDYNNKLSNSIFTFETKLKVKGYKYLNVIKCGYKVHGTVNEWRKELPEKEAILFKKIKQLDIPELRNKEPKIAKQLFKQKLKYQIVLIDKRNMSLLNRKYTLLDLALDRPAGTAQNTIENNGFQKNAHSKSYLQSLLDHSIIDQYQDFSSIITQKKLISISNCGAEFIEKTLKNHSVQFGLIYIQKIIVSELITSLHLWVNENKFKNNLELSKYYMRICRNFDFKIISTKNLYNKYSNYLDLELKINDEKEIIKEKIKEIENILEKEKNQLTNLLLFAIAILELITVFIDDIRDQTAHIFKLNNDIINHIISVSLVIICTLIIYLFLKKTKL